MHLVNGILSTVLAVAIVGGVAIADETPSPEPLACPANSSRLAVKTAGTTAGYPTPCALNACRSVGKVAVKTHVETDPLCNPVLGSCSYVVTDWRYQVQAGADPTTHCPADVLAGPWS